MPRYIVLYRFTDSGRSQLKDTVHRAEEIRELNGAAGQTPVVLLSGCTPTPIYRRRAMELSATLTIDSTR